MKETDFAPVVIPTLCRYEHFKRCVESLAQCTYAQDTELVIGLDYPAKESHKVGWQKIREYIPTITGFKKVTCVEREVNYGSSKNANDLYCYAYKQCGAMIAAEDDNEFSPSFLDFMNQCLRYYENVPSVRSVCGYTQSIYYDTTKTHLFTTDSSAWGFGLWKQKEDEYYAQAGICNINLLYSWNKSWRVFKHFPACLQMFMNMIARDASYGDTKRSILNILNDTYQVRPAISMVRNWGNDGSGLHCQTIDDSFAAQEIQTTPTFELDKNIPVLMTKEDRCAQFYIGLPKPKLLAWAKIAKIILRYIIVRIKFSLT